MDLECNTDSWQNIKHKIDSGKINPYVMYNNNKTLLHIFSARNDQRAIDLLLKNYPKLTNMADLDGNTYAHIMAEYGYYKNLKRNLLKGDSSSLRDCINNKNETILHILNRNKVNLKWFIQLGWNLNIIDSDGFTLLTRNIYNTDEKDTTIKNIEHLIKTGTLAYNIPSYEPPMCVAARLGKTVVVNLLLDRYIPNTDDYYQRTPLILSISEGYDDLINIFIKIDDINHVPDDPDLVPFLLLVEKKYYEIAESIIDKVILIKSDSYLNTILHRIFKKKRDMPSSLITKLLERGDLSFYNIDCITPFWMFVKNYDWGSYKHILIDKDIGDVDMLLRSTQPTNQTLTETTATTGTIATAGTTATTGTIATTSGISRELFNFIIDNYLEKHRGICDGFVQERCIGIIKKHAVTISNETKLKYHGISNPITTFFASPINNLIYCFYFLEKYPNLGMPWYHYNNTILNNLKLYSSSVSTDNLDNTVGLYKRALENTLFELTPSFLLWSSDYNVELPINFDVTLLKLLKDKNKDFIFIKLTLLVEGCMHANCLIYDFALNLLERFEPYGVTQIDINEQIDSYIVANVCSLIPDCDYQSPLTQTDQINYLYQEVSKELDPRTLTTFDPNGYCAAWVYWYLEMRLTNMVSPDILVKRTIKDLCKHKPPMQLIREYANHLEEERIKFMKELGLTHDVYYLAIYPNDVVNLIVDNLRKRFHELV